MFLIRRHNFIGIIYKSDEREGNRKATSTNIQTSLLSLQPDEKGELKACRFLYHGTEKYEESINQWGHVRICRIVAIVFSVAVVVSTTAIVRSGRGVRATPLRYS